jgi:hypothetical protein
MNAQRWIALGVVVLVVACVASSNIWLAPLTADDEEGQDATLTAEAEAIAEDQDTEGEATPTLEGNELTPTPEPTLDPDVAAILEDLEMAELEVGIDPFVTRTGDFTTTDPAYQAEGSASIYQLSEAQRVLRLDNFNITAGPDLRVILSQHEDPRTSAETLLPAYLDLGPLKDTTGAQNYEIPEGESLDDYQSVVIYSMSLNVVYGTATLSDVRGS